MAGTCTYVIGVFRDEPDPWYYVKTEDGNGGIDKNVYSSALADAKRYDDETVAFEDLEKLPYEAKNILEVQKCPKCGHEFTGYPALSREDNETEICPKCGQFEAIKAFVDAQNRA